MKSYEGLVARLAWDGTDEVRLPEEMGKPRADQLQGTAAERLSEVGGRVCYDSCGRGRSSTDFHKHILEVGHLSVYEHFNMTVSFEYGYDLDPWIFVNRPGVWLNREGGRCRVTYNPRVILDWKKVRSNSGRDETLVYLVLREHMTAKCPNIVLPGVGVSPFLEEFKVKVSSQIDGPFFDEERWISIFMGGSRGFSHEQVRHGDWTAISQRSTRYVNEGDSPWVAHPLIQEYLADANLPALVKEGLRVTIGDVEDPARAAYGEIVEKLETWLIKRGVDKFSARKQARGAARGYLGNALYTEMLFSASVAQWKHMLRMRASDAADAEIRAIYIAALPELKRSRYGASFQGFEIVPAKDGLGYCVEEK